MIALVVSVYHLIETSSTHRHGEFPLLYNVWACCLLSESYSQCVAHGVAVHFVLSTAFAKLWVGGFDWIRPETMKTYLSIYYNSSTAKPLFKGFNRFLVEHEWLCSVLSVITLAVEGLIVPLTLVLSTSWRMIGCWSMLLLHVGIATTMSMTVRLAFLTVFPSYFYGFSSLASSTANEHMIAIAVGVCPSLVCMMWGKCLLPEQWPCCPIALFMFNGKQASLIAKTLMTGDTRIAMGTSNIGELPTRKGLVVVHSGALVTTEEKIIPIILHDVVLRVIAFTMLQGSLSDVVPSGRSDWNIQKFLESLERWLRKEQRLIENHTGRQLVNAYHVRIDVKTNEVMEVLVDTS